ncbi:unnamed protein product [Protopolystoma xenopodis]|uniref:Non-specific serine/threonine protein kinase n=1 Tax=Protopolystoma xenopodis TaxID=117903 RepID=A0A3S5AEX8_9PLAT|nr:unnamed protein product [Protopolystoma xenopodis]
MFVSFSYPALQNGPAGPPTSLSPSRSVDSHLAQLSLDSAPLTTPDSLRFTSSTSWSLNQLQSSNGFPLPITAASQHTSLTSTSTCSHLSSNQDIRTSTCRQPRPSSSSSGRCILTDTSVSISSNPSVEAAATIPSIDLASSTTTTVRSNTGSNFVRWNLTAYANRTGRIGSQGAGSTSGVRRLKHLLTPMRRHSPARIVGMCNQLSINPRSDKNIEVVEPLGNSTNITTSNAAGPSIVSGRRLRKVRHLNNIMLVRPGISPAQVLDRLAQALATQAIRFTLKGSGFRCIITNDWGKEMLSFEIEVVHFSPRSINSSSISIKTHFAPINNSNSDSGSTANRHPSDAALMSNTACSCSEDGFGLLNSSASSAGSRCANFDSDPPLNTGFHENAVTCHNFSSDVSLQGLRVGVKTKRAHGDAFTYASICRSLLAEADLRPLDIN